MYGRVSAEICVSRFMNISSKFLLFNNVSTTVTVLKSNQTERAFMVISVHIFCSDMESVASADAQKVSAESEFLLLRPERFCLLFIIFNRCFYTGSMSLGA